MSPACAMNANRYRVVEMRVAPPLPAPTALTRPWRAGGSGDPSRTHSSKASGYRPEIRSDTWSSSPLAVQVGAGSEADEAAGGALRQGRAEGADRVDVAVADQVS